MQNHTTIIGVLDLRAMGCTYGDCRAKYVLRVTFFVTVTSDYFVGWRRKRAGFA